MKNIQISTTPTVDNKAKSIHMVLEGELLLKNMQELAAEVKDVISQYDAIAIELKNIINIDLACIQLLLAAKQTAIADNKKITCHAELPTEVMNVLKHAGLADFPALINK